MTREEKALADETDRRLRRAMAVRRLERARARKELCDLHGCEFVLYSTPSTGSVRLHGGRWICPECRSVVRWRLPECRFVVRYRDRQGYDEDDPGFENAVRAIEEGPS